MTSCSGGLQDPSLKPDGWDEHWEPAAQPQPAAFTDISLFVHQNDQAIIKNSADHPQLDSTY